MPVPTADDILTLEQDTIPTFIQSHAAQQTLSVIMQRLNAAALGPDQTARATAVEAIEHLGFPLSQ